MNEILLLGAGASIEAGVPGAVAMTNTIVERIANDPYTREYARVLYFVLGGLLFQAGVSGKNPSHSGVNVEELFNAVTLLGERHRLEAAPFIGSWHSLVDEFDTEMPRVDAGPLYRAISVGIKEQIEERLKTDGFGGVPSFPHSWDFEREIESLLSQQPQSGKGRIFNRVGEKMIQALVDVVWIDKNDRVEYLSSLLELQRKQRRLVIATLNYDNAVELLFRDRGSPDLLSTGIAEWAATGQLDHSRDGVLLLKLHGSIDWEREDSAGQSMPQYKVRKVPESRIKTEGFKPAVVFGGRNKLTADGPFLDLLRAFRNKLQESELLTVVGYSFRDDHINAIISQWLNQDVGHQLRVIDPGFQSGSSVYGDLLLERCSTRLTVIKKKAGEGLRDAYASLWSVDPSSS